MSSPPSDSNSPPSDSNSPPSDSPPSSNSSPPSSNSSPPSDSSSSPPSSPPPSPPSDSSPSPPSNSSPPPSPPSNSNSSPPPSNSSPPPSPPSDSSPPPSPPSNSSPPPSPPSNSSPPPSPPSNSNPSPPPPANNTPPPSSDSNSPPPPSHNNPPPSNNNHNPPPSNNNHNPPPSQNRNSPPQVPHTPPSPPSRAGLLTPSALSDDSSSSSSNSKSIIIGAAAGAGLLVFILIAFVVACVRRKKRRQMDNMNYYRDNSRSNGYYNPGLHGNSNWNNNLHPPTDHMMKMPPPPGSAQVSSEHGWAMAPPPPPPMMQSSDMSSMGFSGPHQNALPPPHPAMALGFNQSTFTYEELAAATNGFAQSHLLGQGGFGYVHKGVLPNGKEVAVKSLKANSGQGEREFQAEVDIISRVHHRHLVSLVGYCITGAQRMLVYEFVSNGTLEYHLHGTGRPVMEWSTRHKIAMGSAKGFAYLHEDCHPRIIHRDIKTANILIDDHFEAKVADFGLAKLSSENFTHVSTRIMGTFGYLAPEYASSGKLTEKSDVYSYGIMLLELIAGRRPVDLTTDDDNDTLVDWARPILVKVTEGEMESYVELVDPRLGNNYDPQEMLRMVASAAACVRHSARRRPKMSQIVRALEGDVSLEDLNEGVKTGHQALYGSGGSSSSYADLKRIGKPGALSSAEFNSGEHTGEFL